MSNKITPLPLFTLESLVAQAQWSAVPSRKRKVGLKQNGSQNSLKMSGDSKTAK